MFLEALLVIKAGSTSNFENFKTKQIFETSIAITCENISSYTYKKCYLI